MAKLHHLQYICVCAILTKIMQYKQASNNSAVCKEGRGFRFISSQCGDLLGLKDTVMKAKDKEWKSCDGRELVRNWCETCTTGFAQSLVAA